MFTCLEKEEEEEVWEEGDVSRLYAIYYVAEV